VPSTHLTFPTAPHRAWLASQAALPAGFRVGRAVRFTPAEAPKPAKMTLTLIALDEPTPGLRRGVHAQRLSGRAGLVGRAGSRGLARRDDREQQDLERLRPRRRGGAERVCAEAGAPPRDGPAEILPARPA
jgi:glutamate N-acetyltransferase/amino-acid N-acetyltransferase